jgi:ATP-binding cassette subfamily B protein RaxB
MMAKHHGQNFALRDLRQRFPLSLKGANLPRLMTVAGQLGFQCRPLRMDMEHLSQLNLPCILHWDLNHFVVLAKVGKKKVIVLDPAFGKSELSHADVDPTSSASYCCARVSVSILGTRSRPEFLRQSIR